MTQINSKAFLGRGLSFPFRLDPTTGTLAMSENEENIAQSVKLIIKTARGERIMRPDFGTNAADYVFTPRDTSAPDVCAELKRALTLQEPRITGVNVTVLKAAESSLTLDISYVIRSTNNRYNLVYPFYVN